MQVRVVPYVVVGIGDAEAVLTATEVRHLLRRLRRVTPTLIADVAEPSAERAQTREALRRKAS